MTAHITGRRMTQSQCFSKMYDRCLSLRLQHVFSHSIGWVLYQKNHVTFSGSLKLGDPGSLNWAITAKCKLQSSYLEGSQTNVHCPRNTLLYSKAKRKFSCLFVWHSVRPWEVVFSKHLALKATSHPGPARHGCVDERLLHFVKKGVTYNHHHLQLAWESEFQKVKDTSPFVLHCDVLLDTMAVASHTGREHVGGLFSLIHSSSLLLVISTFEYAAVVFHGPDRGRLLTLWRTSTCKSKICDAVRIHNHKNYEWINKNELKL